MCKNSERPIATIHPAVLERMLPEIKHYIQSFVGHADRADDLLQDTVLTALCKIGDLKPPFKFFPWIMTIARNKSIDFLKRQNRFISLDDQPRLLNSLESAGLPKLDLDPKDTAAGHLVNSIDKLAPAMQDILRMKYFSQLSIKDISKILELPEGTIKRRLFDARNQLKKEMIMKESTEATIYPVIKMHPQKMSRIIRRKRGYGLCFGAPVNGTGDMEVCDMYEYPGPILSYRVKSTVTRKGFMLGKDVWEVRNDYEKTENMDTRLLYYSINDSTIEIVFRIFCENPDLRIDMDPTELMGPESLILDTENPGSAHMELLSLKIGTREYPTTIKECQADDDYHGREYIERYWAEDGRQILHRSYIGENWRMGGFVSFEKLAQSPEITFRGETFRLMNEMVLVDHSVMQTQEPAI